MKKIAKEKKIRIPVKKKKENEKSNNKIKKKKRNEISVRTTKNNIFFCLLKCDKNNKLCEIHRFISSWHENYCKCLIRNWHEAYKKR